MNIFRFFGDMLHLSSILMLVFKLQKSKSCVGVSCRTQEIYAMVFVFRYMDLLWLYVSLYNTAIVVMKIIFISSTFFLIYTMRYKPPVCATYDRMADGFPYEKFILPPCALLALITTEDYSITEILWTMSIWLEAAAIFPQLVLLQQLREVENLTSNFVFAMGAYRFLYIVNWVYRYFVEGYVNWVGWVGGLIQTGLYIDFFYYYSMRCSPTPPPPHVCVTSKWYGQRLILPVNQ